MRKITILMASILAMVGCAKNAEFDNAPARNRVEMTVSAGKEISSESPEESRITFNGSVYDMLWEADDQIKVHVESTGETATFDLDVMGEGNKSARFRAEIYEPKALDSYYAYYPANTGYNGTNINFVLPTETTGATTPYLVAAHEEVAMENVALNFKPVTALLELNLGFAADKVVVESVNGESLAGILTYNCANGTITQPAGSSSVTLTSPAAGIHYLYIPEVTLAKGYKVTVTVGNQQMIKTVGYGKEKKFVAGEVTPLTISSFEGIAVNLCDVYTTYTLAQRKNSEANNTSLTNTITFNGDCSYAGLSSTLVKECGVNINGENITATPSNKKFTIDNQTGKGQGAYTVYAYIKLVDGTIYKSAEQTHYITGLPYTVNCKDVKYGDAGWTTTGTVANEYGWRMAYWYGSSITPDEKFGEFFSPTFYAPVDVNVQYTAMVAYFTSGGNANNSKTIYSGVTTGTTLAKTNSKSIKRIYSLGTPLDQDFTACTHNAVLPAGNMYRFCVADEHTRGNNNLAINYISMRQFTVNYAF
ncbi:MAG: hypothetical protein IJA66_08040 [Alistipes sp.]|nr:hypothetical protein [Alistipes sp.]